MLEKTRVAKSTPARGRALVVDDQPAHCLLLKRLLEEQGFDVILAVNGQDAINQFQRHRPGIVFMDVIMPVLDGYQAARMIKSLPQGRFTPIIFLTCLDDPQDLKKCIEAGGNDFLSKPINQVVLNARILASERTRDLYATLREQRQSLNQLLATEQENKRLAQQVLDHALSARWIERPEIKLIRRPACEFSGDIALSAPLPDGGWRVFLADFTGHGLAAAICSLPASELFYKMTLQGSAQTQLLEELNSMLCKLLPDDRFLAAVCVDLSRSKDSLTLWSGGMPPCTLVVDGAVSTLAAFGLPLGVESDYDYSQSQHHLTLPVGGRLLMMSDGFQEAMDHQGSILTPGDDYTQFIAQWARLETDLESLVTQALGQPCRDYPPSDDVTVIEWDLQQ